MPFFELINVHPDYQYPTARLFKSYVDEKQNYIIVIPARPDSFDIQAPFNEVQNTARSLNCSYFIIGDLNRIGETVVVSIAMYQTNDGMMVWNDRLKAATPEDIDPILQKIATALGTENKAVDDESIYSVTNYESRRLKQKRSNSAFGVSIGGMYQMSSALNDDPFSAGGGVFWIYDLREVIFEVDANLYFLGESYMSNLGIKAYYPFLSESDTPIIGGGLGIGHTSFEYFDTGNEWGDYYRTHSGSGMMFFLGGGYIIGRTSDVSLRLMVNYFIGAYKMENPEESMPHGLQFNLELYFGN